MVSEESAGGRRGGRKMWRTGAERGVDIKLDTGGKDEIAAMQMSSCLFTNPHLTGGENSD